MHYDEFVIRNYRAITGPLRIDVSRNNLQPVIGVNESGKTTILHAIFAFDWYNDTLNDGGRHLKDTANLYKTGSQTPRISASVGLTHDELVGCYETIENNSHAWSRLYRKRRQFPTRLAIVRDLHARTYTITDWPFVEESALANLLATEIVGKLPYILFFDDFRDSIDERIEISGTAKDAQGWLAIIDQLFYRTDHNLSVFKLPLLEERQRKSVLAKVKKHLNSTLTREWQNFRLDDSEPLEISLEYEKEHVFVTEAAAGPDAQPKVKGIDRHYLKLEVIEKDTSGDQHYFFIRDRSKGFFWFFNFVMKLEFNPKVVSDNDRTIYLLDEPGSYLHASAQSKLCGKLRQISQRNNVIYCTHSHYLLDPELIALSSIKVAAKDGNGDVRLIPIYDHQGSILERRSAFQPVIDALQIKPFLLDLTAQRVILTEGIYDFYAMELFRHGRNVSVLPSVGASSIKFYISLMVAWRVPFVAVWDNDDEGRKARLDAIETFGDELAESHFFLLPGEGRKRRIMQDLFDGEDIRLFRERLNLSKNTSFEKVIASLYFCPTRTEILNDVTQATRAAFDELFESLPLA